MDATALMSATAVGAFSIFDLARVAVGLVAFGVTAYTDSRTRKAPDEVWIGGCAAGLAVLMAELLMTTSNLLYLLILLPVVVLLIDVFDFYEVIEKRIGHDLFWPMCAVGLASVAAMVALLPWNASLLTLLLIPGFILLAYAFYATRLLHGGGDAKAFVTLAVLIPLWPLLGPLPIISGPAVLAVAARFGFPFFVLFYGALASVLGSVPYNLAKNARDPEAKASFFTRSLGYRMPIPEARKAFVWPMEVVRDGKVVFQRRPGDEDAQEEFAKLEAIGRTHAWITPKIPFLVPMAAGYVIALLLGNVLLLIIFGGTIVKVP